jgi:hypothetical protein
MNANNATSNDKQTTALDNLDNSFNEVNRVRCFNHTLQLSAKTLIKPFNIGMAKASEADTDDMLPLEEFDDGDTDDENGDDDDGGGGAVGLEDEVDEFEELNQDEQDRIMEDTAEVRQAVSKLRQLSFAVIRSTTIALPAWRRACLDHKLKANLIPRDVVTRWNSTHDMMQFALKYRKPIDSITADKSLSLRKYELDNDDWKVIEDLLAMLHVSSLSCRRLYELTNYSQQYKTATLYFSRDSASIAAVIPAMDTLNDTLNPKTKELYHPAILAAMKLARKKMDRYYSLTDDSAPYRIAMGKSWTTKCYLVIDVATASPSSRPQTQILPPTQVGRIMDRRS